QDNSGTRLIQVPGPRRGGQACQHCCPYAANALILGTLFTFCACHGQTATTTLRGRIREAVMADTATRNMASRDFQRQLEGYGLTTAQILYRLPDHPSLLQTYVWQDYDLCPRFPALNRFLAFWLETLEGPLHSVTVAHSRLIRPAEIRAVNGEFRLH